MNDEARQGRQRRTAAWLIVSMLLCLAAFLIPSESTAQQAPVSVETPESPAEVAAQAQETKDTVALRLRRLARELRDLQDSLSLEFEIPGFPDITGLPRVMIIDDGADTTFLQDSIYAVEITAGADGVRITDKSGRQLQVIGLPRVPIVHVPPRFRITGNREDIIQVFSDEIMIPEDEVINGDVVSIFGGRIVVRGRVNGSVTSVLGTIDIDGTVENAAVAPFGSVRIGPSGVVGGDVVASEINKEPGGQIGGIRNQLFFKLFGQDWQPSGRLWLAQAFTVIVILKVLFWVFLVLLAHAIAAKNIAKVKARVERSFFKSFFMGVLIQVLFIPGVALLLVTIIGIPVAIFLLPLMIVAALVLAHAAIGLFIGEKIHENTRLPLPSPLPQTVFGLMTLQSIPLLAVVSLWLTRVGPLGPVFQIISFILIGLSLIVGYVVITLGTGAVVMTRFGTRPKDPKPEPSAEPTPLPSAEGGVSSEARTPTPLPHPRSEEPGTATAT